MSSSGARISVRAIPFHTPSVDEAEIRAVSEVMGTGWMTMGPRTLEFEREFARYVGAPHAVAVSSCTAALHLALEAVGIGAGDEVLVPTTTFTATAEVATYLGARPVLVDIDPRTMNMDPQDAARRVTPQTRAMIPVHLAGQPCDMDALADLAQRHGLRVIEDAAHALPASFAGQRVGNVSELTAFSFYITKPLTTGEGGMVTTRDAALAERMRIMRLHGISRDAWKRYTAEGSWFYQVHAAGYKYNMADTQAAMGLVQLRKCDALLERRRAIAARYTAAFGRLQCLETPAQLPDRQSSWHLYVLRLHLARLKIGRDLFIERLKDQGIGTSVHFIPLHLQPFYQQTFGYRPGDLPNAEAQYARCLSLPIFPAMGDDDVDRVIESVTEIARDAAR